MHALPEVLELFFFTSFVRSLEDLQHFVMLNSLHGFLFQVLRTPMLMFHLEKSLLGLSDGL